MAAANQSTPDPHFRTAAVILACVLFVVAFAALRSVPAAPIAQATSPTGPSSLAAPADQVRLAPALARMPLVFEANEGQTDSQVKYLARGAGYTLFLTKDGAVLSLPVVQPATKPAVSHAKNFAKAPARFAATSVAVVRMRMPGANLSAPISGTDALPGKTNYYLGNDPRRWRTGVSQYARVRYADVYPGVDLAFHGEQRQLEFDFIVTPGADASPIGLSFTGADRVATNPAGDLVLSSAAGDFTLHKPVAYQEQNGVRQLVDARFDVRPDKQVSFVLGNYDRSRELVIDPSLSYSTFLGGTAEDEGFAIAVDSSGNAYIAGQTFSPDFPKNGGTVSSSGGFDAFVTKLNAAGSAITFTTLIGGSTGTANDAALGVAVISSGTGTGVYVVGNTTSNNFPATQNIGPRGNQDAFAAKLSTSGVVSYIARIGGAGIDSANAIAADGTGNAYIAGETFSTDYPTVGPIQATNGGTSDAFVTKLNTTGSAAVYSTYLGGTSGDPAFGIAVDGSDNAYVTGTTLSGNFPTTAGAFQTAQPGGTGDGFVAKINSTGSALVYSTYLGGASGTDDSFAIAVDSNGEAYVAGDTASTNFPTVNAQQTAGGGANDAFVAKLKPDGSGLLFSTYLGGTLDDAATGLGLDGFNDVYVTGQTKSANFPTAGSPFQGALNGGNFDAFVTELSNTGYMVYSSYLGGTGDDNALPVNLAAVGAVAVDSNSAAYLTGSTSSTTGFPTQSPFQSAYAGGSADAFVTKVGAAPSDFSVAVAPTSVSVASGQTTSAVTITVASVNSAFGGSVALSCTSLPTNASCAFSSTSANAGDTPTVTVSTHAGIGSLFGHSSVYYAMWLPVVGLALLGVGVAPRKRRLMGFLALVVVFAGLMLLGACGGGGNGGGGGGGGGGTNTPRGTYHINVVGTSGSTHGAPLTLVVN